MSVGIPPESIVRLGSKSTPETQALLLSQQRSSTRHSQAAWNLINTVVVEAQLLQTNLRNEFRESQDLSVNWVEILEYLEFSENECHFHDAFQVPDSQDGMTRVGQKGKAIGRDYLLRRWADGYDSGVFANELPGGSHTVWNMNRPTRQAHIDRWVRDILEEDISRVARSVESYNECQSRLDEAWSEKTVTLINEKRIIGCTTTAAARYTREFQSVAPGVIIVEEAGEILESHVLAALSSNTKQLVLIGDHKQLRPKVNNYALTVEKGHGYNLNRSMFERLILDKYPHVTLRNQHRMCPEISTLVRHLTYPDLLDNSNTLNRPTPRGLQDRVIFFGHRVPEVAAQQIADRRDEGSKISKQNAFEAELVLKIVRYLAQQGYGTDRLVVLTPYLGQLHLLLEKLSKENDPVLNDLDSFDLVRAGLLSNAGAQMSKRRIKISTIGKRLCLLLTPNYVMVDVCVDNYQGEESDIVIASLTRSNDAGDIGFMAAPERLNVLLSRAREALIMIGNANTFLASRRAKEAWEPLFNKLKENGHVYDGLPVKCAQHPTRLNLLQRAEDFDKECPDGGCAEPW